MRGALEFVHWATISRHAFPLATLRFMLLAATLESVTISHAQPFSAQTSGPENTALAMLKNREDERLQDDARDLAEANLEASARAREQTERILADQARGAADAERYKVEKTRYEADLIRNKADVAEAARARAAYAKEMAAYRLALKRPAAGSRAATEHENPLSSTEPVDAALTRPAKPICRNEVATGSTITKRVCYPPRR